MPYVVAAAVAAITLAPGQVLARGARLNVVHVIVDDLRSELGCFGAPNASSPTLDRLAARGTVFTQAFAQQAVCAPSRNSFLSGRRPDRSRCWNFINSFREDHPTWTTLPGGFKRNGYLSLGSGKIFHPDIPPAYDGQASWSTEALPFYNPCWNTGDNPNNTKGDGGLPCAFCPVDIAGRIFHTNVSVVNENCEIDAYEDSLTVNKAIELIRAAAGKNQPFYIAVGLHKPHLPFQASAADFAKHPLETVAPPLYPLPPDRMPPIAFHFTDSTVPEHTSLMDPVSPEHARMARRAYRAAVTGMDRKLGKLVDEVDRLSLTESTIWAIHSDHGWQLGELGEWRKMTLFENAVKVPLIIVAPHLRGTVRQSNALVELVDLAPTLWDLAGVPTPPGERYDGVSLVPLLTGAASAVKGAAFSQYPRRVTHPSEPWRSNSIIHHNRSTFTHMGLSIRTKDYRYTEWRLWNTSTLQPKWDEVPVAAELYNHSADEGYPVDFDRFENFNLANRSDTAVAIAANLSKLLQAQFQ